MDLFGKSPQEQAMQTLIHDHRNDMDSLDHHIKKLGEWVAANGKAMHEAGMEVSSMPYIIVEYLKSDSKRIKDSIDDYYNKFKADFNTEEIKQDGK